MHALSHAFRSSALLLGLGVLAAVSARGDLNNELAFSAFPNPDLNALAAGQVLQARGGLIDFQRGITTQSLYMIDAQPGVVQDKLAHWSPSSHPELKVWLHLLLPQNPTARDFSGMNGLPDNSSINNMVNATYAYTPGSTSLQLNNREAQVLAAGHGQSPSKDFIVNSWSQILAARITDFLKGNVADESYTMEDEIIRPLDEARSLLRSDPKVHRDYLGMLSGTPVFGALKTPPTYLYYECFDIEGTAAFGTGAIYQATSPSTIQQADIEFYVNSGIYASIELEQLWPVNVGGRAETLVWRDDMVSTSNIAYLHGTERLASGMIMLQDVKQAIDAFRAEFK
jgi:hypothetical protein